MILARLKELAADTFEVDPEDVSDDAAAGVMTAWTSLRHLQFMGAIEQEFGVRLTLEEMLSLQSLPALVAFLRTHGHL
jgi:acyl carrier protein